MYEDQIVGHSTLITQGINSSQPYINVTHRPKMTNPFLVSRPKSNIVYKSAANQANPKHGKIINFENNWTKFCRGKLSVKSYLSCKACGHCVCKQSDVKPHTYQWYKAANQERNQTGFAEDDNDGGLAGTFSRLVKRVDTDPRECNCVFLKKPEWMRFYTINNGSTVGCPQCGTMVGMVKLSGLKCSCGHWEVPGYQI